MTTQPWGPHPHDGYYRYAARTGVATVAMDPPGRRAAPARLLLSTGLTGKYWLSWTMILCLLRL
jgi:hypothetical protein